MGSGGEVGAVRGACRAVTAGVVVRGIQIAVDGVDARQHPAGQRPDGIHPGIQDGDHDDGAGGGGGQPEAGQEKCVLQPRCFHDDAPLVAESGFRRAQAAEPSMILHVSPYAHLAQRVKELIPMGHGLENETQSKFLIINDLQKIGRASCRERV